MLAVNIAFGTLYLGLPAARYRTKLLDSIESRFRSKQYSDDAKAKLRERLAESKVLLHQYHRAATWAKEVTANRLRNTSASLFEAVKDPDPLPLSYRWFKCNGDKGVCFLLLVLLPSTLLWIMVAGLYSQAWLCWYAAALALGQGCVAFHVLLGIWMVWRHGNKLRRALDDCLAAAEMSATHVFISGSFSRGLGGSGQYTHPGFDPGESDPWHR